MSTNPVITSAEARKITGGRTPLVPVQYETAMAALAECREIDEAKIWSDKADALAAWAKIYHSDEADRQAKLLKLHAYRRMGELAKELRPSGREIVACPNFGHGKGAKSQATPGPRSLLMESGLSSSQADAAVRLSKIPGPQFENLISADKIPSPAYATGLGKASAAQLCSARISVLASSTRSISPSEFVKGAPQKGSVWRENAEEVYEWLGLVLGKDRSQ